MIMPVVVSLLFFAAPGQQLPGTPSAHPTSTADTLDVADPAPQDSANLPVALEQPVPSAPTVSVPPLPPAVRPVDGQADITVTARPGPTAIDPLESINQTSFKATQAVDRVLTRPAAMAYERHVPSPIRSGLRNFFLNLHEVDVFLNFWAQLKPGKAMETAGRFAINSTIGVAGLFDMAQRKPFHLPRRRNSLADTLGYYGVGPGPFFFLPLIGPTTLRDVVGNSLDGLVLPTLIGKPFTGTTYTVPSSLVRALDHRGEFDDQISAAQADPSPYNATREDYLRRRQIEIDHLRGRDR